MKKKFFLVSIIFLITFISIIFYSSESIPNKLFVYNTQTFIVTEEPFFEESILEEIGAIQTIVKGLPTQHLESNTLPVGTKLFKGSAETDYSIVVQINNEYKVALQYSE